MAALRLVIEHSFSMTSELWTSHNLSTVDSANSNPHNSNYRIIGINSPERLISSVFLIKNIA